MGPQERDLYESILKPAQKMLGESTAEGVLIDREYLLKCLFEQKKRISKLEFEFIQEASKLGFSASDVIKTEEASINLRSPKQLKHLFYGLMGLKSPMWDGKETTGKEFIEKYKDEYPIVDLLNICRRSDRLKSVYLEGILEYLSETDKIHPDIFIGATVTGRLSAKKPPVQTIPRESLIEELGFPSIKKLFTSSDNHLFVEADYKQLELRIAWHLSGDINLGKALMSGDFHLQTASIVFDKPKDQVTKEERYSTKAITFGVMYGRQAKALALNELKPLTGGNPRIAQHYIDAFWELYPQYREWTEKIAEQAITKGYVRVLETGRTRRWNIITEDMKYNIKNKAVNFPVQSLASDLNLISMIKLHTILKEKKLGRVLFPVHDSICFEIHEDYLEESINIIKSTMTDPFFSTDVIFEVDISYGKSWKS